MVFGTGIDELAIVGVALSLPFWLAIEEIISRSHLRPMRPRRVETPRGEPAAGMIKRPAA
jgi:hypothetical protein